MGTCLQTASCLVRVHVLSRSSIPGGVRPPDSDLSPCPQQTRDLGPSFLGSGAVCHGAAGRARQDGAQEQVLEHNAMGREAGSTPGVWLCGMGMRTGTWTGMGTGCHPSPPGPHRTAQPAMGHLRPERVLTRIATLIYSYLFSVLCALLRDPTAPQEPGPVGHRAAAPLTARAHQSPAVAGGGAAPRPARPQPC